MTNSSYKILVVDDELELLDVIADNLKFFGYVPFTAGSSNQAFKILTREHIDLVICDYMMPEMSGEELFLKADRLVSFCPPFIFCSGLDELSFKNNTQEGFLGFLQKPFSMNELMQKIESYFATVA